MWATVCCPLSAAVRGERGTRSGSGESKANTNTPKIFTKTEEATLLFVDSALA